MQEHVYPGDTPGVFVHEASSKQSWEPLTHRSIAEKVIKHDDVIFVLSMDKSNIEVKIIHGCAYAQI